ncbi:MAG: hypothetical protein J6T33_01245 [Bacteroidales bacterium]|nr:hypothetical protein [Bacteroidales bacterium]
MKKIAFCLLFAVAFAGSAFAQDVPKDTCLLKGRVCIVDNFEDLKVRIVNAFGDVRVDVVTTVGDDSECGQIELVNSFPYLRVKVVESLTEDITISFRDESSRKKFMEFVEQSKKR